jgi:uncharacterized protein GlcG (DUF336 family)
MTALDLETARRIVAAAREFSAQQTFKPLLVTVLDAGGHVVVAEREDGASIGRFDIAYGKAHGAIALGLGSRAIMNRAEQQAYFVAAAGMAIGGHLVPVPGGVLIRTEAGHLIGAVGISGDTSDNDESAAIAGIESVGLVADPG